MNFQTVSTAPPRHQEHQAILIKEMQTTPESDLIQEWIRFEQNYLKDIIKVMALKLQHDHLQSELEWIQGVNP